MELIFDQVTKKYNTKLALDQFSLTLTPGVHALLGPNGAGKSTLMNILVGLLLPTEGQILFDGREVRGMGEEFRELLGYLPQNPGFYPSFTGRQIMLYYSALKGLKNPEKRVDELLEMVNLKEDAKKKYRAYSGGMKRRLGIAVTLLNDPKLLVLDEPTAGLDPKERIRFRNVLQQLSKDKIILVATHIVSDVESIADNIILLKEGRIVALGNPAELEEQVAEQSGKETASLEDVYMQFFEEESVC